MSKTCTKCKLNKSFDSFSKRKLSKDGKSSQCKSCMKSISKDWYQNNKQRKSEYSSDRYQNNKEEYTTRVLKWQEKNSDKLKTIRVKWEEENKEHRTQYLANWHQENRERRLISASEWQKENPEKARAKHAAYRSRKLNATPPWFTEFDELVMTEAYHLLDLRREATGFDWNVDHMIPLRGKKVCGLHIGNNVQVIPEALNQTKSNKQILTEPFEWLKSFSILYKD